jgi:hypothetical protein
MKMKKLVVMMFAMLLIAAVAVQAALTAARDTPQRSGDLVSIGVASNTTIYAGAMTAINTSGYAVPASDTTNLVVIGRAEQTVANASTDGAVSIAVRRGVFRWTNGDTVSIANVGAVAYVEDDATVTVTNSTSSVVAGTILAVDSDGVWVDSTTK